MKSFGNYDLITEKVSKTEINDGLKDPNIRTGIEYEFVFNEDVLSDEEGQTAYEQYLKLKADIASASLQVHDERDKYEDEIRLILAVTLNNLQNKVNELKKEVGNKYPTDDAKWAEINALIDQTYEIEELQSLSPDEVFSSDVDHIEWSSEFPVENGWEDDIDLPRIGSTKYEGYFWWLSNYQGVDVDTDELKRSSINTIFDPDADIDELFDEFEMIEPVGDIGKYDHPSYDQWVEIFQRFDDDDPYLPFDSSDPEYYNVDETRGEVRHWGVGSDSSLPYSGCEVTTPIQKLSDSIPDLQNMLKFITKKGYTNQKCGLHVNMSYKGKSFEDFDALKVMLFMDERVIYKWFDERENNSYAQSVIKQVRNAAGDLGNMRSLKKIPMKGIFTDFRKGLTLPSDKYYGVNIENTMYGGRSDRVEFRYLGGSNYHHKMDFIVSQIGRFSYYMKLGFNENYKKNEYITKLTRLYNRYYTNKPEDLSVISDNMMKLILKKGLFVGADKNNYHIYIYKGKAYTMYTSYGDIEIINVKPEAEAKRQSPFYKTDRFVNALGEMEKVGDVKVVLSKYQTTVMVEYKSRSNKNLYLVDGDYKTISGFLKDEFKRQGNKIILR